MPSGLGQCLRRRVSASPGQYKRWLRQRVQSVLPKPSIGTGRFDSARDQVALISAGENPGAGDNPRLGQPVDMPSDGFAAAHVPGQPRFEAARAPGRAAVKVATRTEPLRRLTADRHFHRLDDVDGQNVSARQRRDVVGVGAENLRHRCWQPAASAAVLQQVNRVGSDADPPLTSCQISTSLAGSLKSMPPSADDRDQYQVWTLADAGRQRSASSPSQLC